MLTITAPTLIMKAVTKLHVKNPPVPDVFLLAATMGTSVTKPYLNRLL